MSKKGNFVKNKDVMFEKVLGRDHFWHYHPELIEKAGTYMVKVTVPEGKGHDFHRHPEMHEILYILKGRAEQWIEDEMQHLGAGDSVYIDTDAAHATFNAGDGELEFLAILSPSQGWEAGTVDVSNEQPYVTYRKQV